MQDPRTLEDLKVLFHRWYEVPIKVLSKIENGDGGFVALGIALMLYERFVQAQHGQEVKIDRVSKDLSSRLNISNQDARDFWKIFRHGLLHSAMPKLKDSLPSYWLSHELEQPIQRGTHNGKDVLYVEPWRFAEFVLDLWRQHPEMLNLVLDNPFPIIVLPDDWNASVNTLPEQT